MINLINYNELTLDHLMFTLPSLVSFPLRSQCRRYHRSLITPQFIVQCKSKNKNKKENLQIYYKEDYERK